IPIRTVYAAASRSNLPRLRSKAEEPRSAFHRAPSEEPRSHTNQLVKTGGGPSKEDGHREIQSTCVKRPPHRPNGKLGDPHRHAQTDDAKVDASGNTQGNHDHKANKVGYHAEIRTVCGSQAML